MASWNPAQLGNTEESILKEISRIMAASLSDVEVDVTPKHNQKSISHFRLKL
jgi:hypothetical protein